MIEFLESLQKQIQYQINDENENENENENEYDDEYTYSDNKINRNNEMMLQNSTTTTQQVHKNKKSDNIPMNKKIYKDIQKVIQNGIDKINKQKVNEKIIGNGIIIELTNNNQQTVQKHIINGKIKFSLETFEEVQKQFCMLFFEQEPVFKQKYVQLYGNLKYQWEQTKQDWLVLMQSIHKYFFSQLEDNEMKFHFMRTFEFLITRLIRSFKQNDVNQYLQKWLQILPRNLLAFLFDYGYEIIHKYHQVYLGYSNKELIFNNRDLIKDILLKSSPNKNPTRNQLINYLTHSQQQLQLLESQDLRIRPNTGAQLLRRILSCIQSGFIHTKTFRNFNRTLTSINSNSFAQKFVFWYENEQINKGGLGDINININNHFSQMNYMKPFTGNISQYPINDQLEQDFYKQNINKLYNYYDSIEELHQQIEELYLRKFNEIQTSQQSGIELDKEINQYQQQLENIQNQQYNEAYKIFPLNEQKQESTHKLSYLQSVVLDKLVNSLIDSQNLICVNGIVIQKNQTDYVDLNVLQMKLHCLPMLQIQTQEPINIEQPKQTRKRKQQINNDNEQLNKKRFQTNQSIILIQQNDNQPTINHQESRDNQLIQFIYNKKKRNRQIFQKNKESYNELIKSVYLFLYFDINLTHLLDEQYGSRKFLLITLPRIMKDYIFKNKEILFQYNMVQFAHKRYMQSSIETQNEFQQENQELYKRLEEANALRIFSNYDNYQLNQNEQNEKHKYELQQQQNFQLNDDEINILRKYDFIDEEHVSMCNDEQQQQQPMFNKFKDYVMINQNENQKQILYALNQCYYQYGEINEIFQKQLNEYKQFRQILIKQNRLQKKFNIIKQQTASCMKDKQKKTNLLLRINKLEKQLEENYEIKTKPQYTFEKPIFKQSNEDTYIEEFKQEQEKKEQMRLYRESKYKEIHTSILHTKEMILKQNKLVQILQENIIELNQKQQQLEINNSFKLDKLYDFEPILTSKQIVEGMKNPTYVDEIIKVQKTQYLKSNEIKYKKINKQFLKQTKKINQSINELTKTIQDSEQKTQELLINKKELISLEFQYIKDNLFLKKQLEHRVFLYKQNDNGLKTFQNIDRINNLQPRTRICSLQNNITINSHIDQVWFGRNKIINYKQNEFDGQKLIIINKNMQTKNQNMQTNCQNPIIIQNIDEIDNNQ